MSYLDICPVCDNRLNLMPKVLGADLKFDCGKCSSFIVTLECLAQNEKRINENRSTISTWINNQNKMGNKVPTLDQKALDLITKK